MIVSRFQEVCGQPKRTPLQCVSCILAAVLASLSAKSRRQSRYYLATSFLQRSLRKPLFCGRTLERFWCVIMEKAKIFCMEQSRHRDPIPAAHCTSGFVLIQSPTRRQNRSLTFRPDLYSLKKARNTLASAMLGKLGLTLLGTYPRACQRVL